MFLNCLQFNRHLTSAFILGLFLFHNTLGWAATSSPSLIQTTGSSLHSPTQTELSGLLINPDNVMSLRFLVIQNENPNPDLSEESLLIAKYFLSALTIQPKDLWVNLSPLEPSRILPKQTGETQLGQDLLLEDYFLKQLTSSLINPESTIGKKFWERVYTIMEKHEITQNALEVWSKIWIVPAQAKLTEHANGVTIVDAKLKIMLEEDYLARQASTYSSKGTPSPQFSEEIKNIFYEVVLPEIEKEINEGETFSALRQIYAAVLLADWYKQKLRESILTSRLAEQNKIIGLEGQRNIQNIYESYLSALQSGAANIIREEYDADLQSVKPVHYFTGGADLTSFQERVQYTKLPIPENFYTDGKIAEITINPAMLNVEVEKLFELHKNEPLAQQISSLEKLFDELKSGGQNTPHDIAEFQDRLNTLKEEFRGSLQKQSYGTHTYEFKERFYYNLIYTLVRPNSNLITFRHFVEKTLLDFLKKTKQNQVLIAVSGKAASGKTTLAEIILNLKNYVRRIKNFNWNVLMLSYDDYMIEKEDRDPNSTDPESPFSKSRNDRFNKDAEKLKNNENVWTPIYDQTAKGQLKMGLDEQGRAVIFNGNARMTFVRDNDTIRLQIQKNNNDAANRRTLPGEIIQSIELKHDVPTVIKAFGGLTLEMTWLNGAIQMSSGYANHTLVLPTDDQDNYYYQAEAQDPVRLEIGQKTEMLRYIPRLENGEKRIIVFEGFMTLTAASHCDFTTNIETSSPIRIWRSILREIARGRTEEGFLREHLHTLLKRELSEDVLIDKLTLEARQNNGNHGAKHFDIINYSVAEMLASELLNRGILQGDLNSLSKQIPEASEIIHQVESIRNDALKHWLIKRLKDPSESFSILNPRQWHAETETKGLWHTVQIDENILVEFLWSEGAEHETEIPNILKEIHRRSRGPIAGFNILDVSKENISINVVIDGSQQSIRLGRVALIENLPSIGESLDLLEHPAARSPEWNRVKLKTPEAWIDQFFFVQNMLWQRGLIDFEPSPYNYGIKNFDDRLVLMLSNFSSIVNDKHALHKISLFSKKAYIQTTKNFYQNVINSLSTHDQKKAVRKFSNFQLRFIANPETGENYLNMIPEKYRDYYIQRIWDEVPRDVREMRHVFNKTWNSAHSNAGSSIKDDTPSFRNQGIPTFDVYNAVIQHLSKRLENIFLMELQKTFLRTYQSAQEAPAAGQTPQQQWLMDVYLNQNRNFFDYMSSMTKILMEKLISNPDWLSNQSKEISHKDILESLWDDLNSQRGGKNLPLREEWKDIHFERIIAFTRKLPSNWKDVHRVSKAKDAAMMTESHPFLKGGVDLSLQSAEISISQSTQGGFQPLIQNIDADVSLDHGISLQLNSIVPATSFPREYVIGY